LNRRRRGLLAGLGLAALLAGCGERGAAPDAQAASAPLVVFAAASLKEALDAASAAYQQSGGAPVQVSYAASPALARQIAQRAPADVFISADGDWMDWLAARGLVDPASRVDLLGNHLVLVGPAASTARPALAPGTDLLPLLGPQGRLAVAMTDSVPAGKYARAALQSLGMLTALQPRLAEAENVRAALLLVARGDAPLGVVYASDARAEPRVAVLATFPGDSHPPIVYPAARVGASTHPQAQAFIDWLGTPAADAIFRAHGLDPR
jgi:molybdate transport system substrate-binding protein